MSIEKQTNQAKHGISFEEAGTVFDVPVFTAPDDRSDYDEERCVSYGLLGGVVVVVVVHTSRRGRIRLISARKANRREQREYYEHLERAIEAN